MEEIKKFRPDMCRGRGTATMQFCVMFGQFESLKWLFENGCSLQSFLISFASLTNHLDVVYWLIENNCPIPTIADVPIDNEEMHYLLLQCGVSQIQLVTKKYPPPNYWGLPGCLYTNH